MASNVFSWNLSSSSSSASISQYPLKKNMQAWRISSKQVEKLLTYCGGYVRDTSCILNSLIAKPNKRWRHTNSSESAHNFFQFSTLMVKLRRSKYSREIPSPQTTQEDLGAAQYSFKKQVTEQEQDRLPSNEDGWRIFGPVRFSHVVLLKAHPIKLDACAGYIVQGVKMKTNLSNGPSTPSPLPIPLNQLHSTKNKWLKIGAR